MVEKIKNFILEKPKHLAFGTLALFFVNVYLYANLFTLHGNKNLQIYFLNVGQGDSELIQLPDNVKILVDAGPANRRAVQELSKILSPFDRRIDIALISHPQLDHYGGLSDIIDRYQITAFISNGEKAETSSAYQELQGKLQKHKIEKINLVKGDRIRYRDSVIEIINPPNSLIGKAKDLNDTSIVMLLKSENIKALFTGDIGGKTEKQVASLLGAGIDILKVPHHGSKYSSSENFLAKTKSKIGVIEVGKNSYGHPTKEALSRLKKYGIQTYRTDENGTIKMVSNGKAIEVYGIR